MLDIRGVCTSPSTSCKHFSSLRSCWSTLAHCCLWQCPDDHLLLLGYLLLLYYVAHWAYNCQWLWLLMVGTLISSSEPSTNPTCRCHSLKELLMAIVCLLKVGNRGWRLVRHHHVLLLIHLLTIHDSAICTMVNHWGGARWVDILTVATEHQGYLMSLVQLHTLLLPLERLLRFFLIWRQHKKDWFLISFALLL